MFQDDIFPPCAAGIPALSADEWTAGVTKSPILVSITADGLGGTSSGATLVSHVTSRTLLLVSMSMLVYLRLHLSL